MAVLLGRNPLPNADQHHGYFELLTIICDEEIPIPRETISSKLSDFIAGCLNKSADGRPSVRDLLSNSFFSDHSASLWQSLVNTHGAGPSGSGEFVSSGDEGGSYCDEPMRQSNSSSRRNSATSTPTRSPVSKRGHFHRGFSKEVSQQVLNLLR